MLKIRFVISATLLMLGYSLLQAQIVQQKKGYMIYVKFRPKQVIKQKMTVQMQGNSGQSSTSQFITKCLTVDKKGISTLEVTVPGGVDGKPTKKKVKVDNHGKPIGSTLNGFSGNFVWPDVPIKLGESWVGDMNMMGGAAQGGGMALKSTYKFAGIKTIRGEKVASISSVIKVTGTYDMSGTGVIYVRFSDGQLQSASFNMSLNQYSSGNAKTKLNVVMTISTLP